MRNQPFRYLLHKYRHHSMFHLRRTVGPLNRQCMPQTHSKSRSATLKFHQGLPRIKAFQHLKRVLACVILQMPYAMTAIHSHLRWFAVKCNLVHQVALAVHVQTLRIDTRTWLSRSTVPDLSLPQTHKLTFLCSSTMRRPVRASDGFVYEEASVRIYFAKERRCGRPLRSPMTGISALQHDTLFGHSECDAW
jgi:hypothetical protein